MGFGGHFYSIFEIDIYLYFIFFFYFFFFFWGGGVGVGGVIVAKFELVHNVEVIHCLS